MNRMIMAAFVILFFGCARHENFTDLKGPYLGQDPPGMTPRIFAPDLLNNEKTGAF